MLLNLVKMRYGDAPVFLEVSSIINQYDLEGQVSLTHNWPDGSAVPAYSGTGIGRYYDRPTITYTPMTGDKFTRSMMTPIPPSTVLNLIQNGKSSEFIIRLCVQSMNGIQNQGISTPADPCFVRLIQLISAVQDAGGVVLKFGDGKNKAVTYLIITQPQDPKAAAARAEIRSVLKLKPDATEVRVVYGGSPSNDTEVAMVTRSVFDIMTMVALSAEVPQEDIDQGRSYPASPLLRNPDYKPLAVIRNGKSKPKDAAVMVRYRGMWFWLDDRDLNSKRVFSALLLMVNLAESGQPAAAPLVTLPSG
jgi:hypothetical protein